jgi:hypothetical protein
MLPVLDALTAWRGSRVSTVSFRHALDVAPVLVGPRSMLKVSLFGPSIGGQAVKLDFTEELSFEIVGDVGRGSVYPLIKGLTAALNGKVGVSDDGDVRIQSHQLLSQSVKVGAAGLVEAWLVWSAVISWRVS